MREPFPWQGRKIERLWASAAGRPQTRRRQPNPMETICSQTSLRRPCTTFRQATDHPVYPHPTSSCVEAGKWFSREALVRKGGLEPPWVTPPDPKSGASANFDTFARLVTVAMHAPSNHIVMRTPRRLLHPCGSIGRFRRAQRWPPVERRRLPATLYASE